MEPKNKTEQELELSQYLEDNSDMIFGTDFLFSPPNEWLLNRLSQNFSGSSEVIQISNT
jgi:hypothetical protein